MSHTLVQIGNSKAIIIPARIIKRRNYNSKTEFDIIETSEGLSIIHKKTALESLEFPKAAKPVISDKVKGLQSVVKFSDEELNQDERLKYILER